MESRVILPCDRLSGQISVSGDKSISHRAAMLASIADGESRVRGFLESEDCLNTLRAVEVLGAVVSRDGAEIRIRGTGGRYTEAGKPLDMGNSGTGMRLLSGLLAGQPFTTELTGDASLLRRPMDRIREPLVRMGAKVELLGEDGRPPVRISGGSLVGTEYELPVASAQVKSCVLLGGIYAGGETRVREPRPTRDHTERMLRTMGAEIAVDGAWVNVRGSDGRPRLRPLDVDVPGDFSSAAFWLAAAACREGSTVSVQGVGLNPRRTAFLDVLRRMGARVEVSTQASGSGEWEPAGCVCVEGARLRATGVGGDEIPNLIDELPLVAVLGAVAEGVTYIRDARELRVKESDRIATMAQGLAAFGTKVDVMDDGMRVCGGTLQGGVDVSSYGDHRVAMALAVCALCASDAVRVCGVECIETSYPAFWDDLKILTAM